MSDPGKAIFLSYASQDAGAARRICEALRSGGVEVWFDVEGGLEHGDEWDAKIRRQIKECVLFIPVISANTQARHEGYFRLEWDLAAERARSIASGVPFILPVVIDDTREPDALVPDRFRMVQWTKLRGGEVPAEVKQRFLKLWSHRTGALKHESGRGARTSSSASIDPAGGTPALPHVGRRVPTAAWIAAVIAVGALVSFITLRPKPQESARTRPPALNQPNPPAAENSAAPLSEARQLVARAWALLNRPEMGRAELETAEALCKRAGEKDPTDAEVWAVWTHVHTWQVAHNFDRTTTRYEAAADCATRAMQLDPQAYGSRLAQAFYWVRGQRTTPPTLNEEARKLLRQLLAEKPDEPRALFALGYSLLKKAPTMKPEGIEALERLAKNPAFAALAWMEIGWEHRFRGEYSRAEEAADKSIAAAPYWNNLGLKIGLALEWRGDPELALATLRRMPPAVLQEDFGIGFADWVYEWGRKHSDRLAFLSGVSKEWLNSQMYIGPRAFLVGQTRQALRQTESGERELRRALELIEQKLNQAPNDSTLLLLKARTLLGLGQRPEAEKAFRLAKEISRSAAMKSTAVLFEAPDVVLAEFERAYESKLYWPTAATMRLNSDWDTLRDLPRFKALQAKLDADPRTSPNASAAQSSSTTAIAPDPKSVAVLPFANQSADKDNEYFSDGIAEELRIVLQKIPGLRVAARASAWSFKGKNPTNKEVGEKLGVAHVVEGSVYKDGNRVKITARLSHAANNEELWSEKFGPLELTDVFATQSEIAQAIVTALRGRLIGESTDATATKAEIQAQVQASAKGGTKNVEAHQLFLQGKFFAIQFSRENIARAIGNFRRATDLDSSFALAWAELSSALTVQGAWGMTDRPLPEVFGEARRAAGRALDLEPNLAEGYAALSLVRLRYDLDWKGAAAAALRALDLAPSDATIISNAAQALQAIGQTDRAIDLARQALTLDPLNTEARNNVGYGYWSVGKFKEAEQEYRRVLDLNPAAQGAQSAIGLAVLFQGRIDEAAAHIEREPDPVFRNNGLALVRWAQKRVPEADAALQAAIARADIVSYQVAETYAYRNDLDQAFAWLERARENHDSGLGIVRTDLLLRPLHSDPRWPAFLRKIGLHNEQLK